MSKENNNKDMVEQNNKDKDKFWFNKNIKLELGYVFMPLASLK